MFDIFAQITKKHWSGQNANLSVCNVKIIEKLDSLPAWPQEAYRPQHVLSMAYSVRGGGAVSTQ